MATIPNTAIELLTTVEKRIPKKSLQWIPCDVVAVIAYLFPESILELSQHNATVELQGLYTRGELVLDAHELSATNVTVIEAINRTFVENILIKTAHTVTKKNY